MPRWLIPIGLALGGLALGVLLAPVAPVSAQTVVATLQKPTPIGAHDGHLVWSQYDPATGAFYLMRRTGGRNLPLPVAPRGVPFDVDLGPGPAGGTLAVYSRCSAEPRFQDAERRDGLPIYATGRGCDLYRFDFATGRESALAGASSRRASEFLPSVWREGLAFARVYERRPGRRGAYPYLYLRRRPGERPRRQPGGARGRYRRLGGRLEGGPGPTSLDLFGRRLGIGWEWHDSRFLPVSEIRLDTLGRRSLTVSRLANRTRIATNRVFSPSFGRLLYYGQTCTGDEQECSGALGPPLRRYLYNGYFVRRRYRASTIAPLFVAGLAQDGSRMFSLEGQNGGDHVDCGAEGRRSPPRCELIERELPFR